MSLTHTHDDLPVQDWIAGYRVVVELDDNGVNCWIASADDRHANSLACLEDNGAFDDGPDVPQRVLDAARRLAERYGY